MIAVDNKLIKIKQQGKEVAYFSIITQINKSQFQIKRRYQEILDLEKLLKDIYKEYNFPLKLPELEKINLQQFEDEVNFVRRRAEKLQSWIVSLCKTPFFTHKHLLDFLAVDEQTQQPFLGYFLIVSQ